LEFNKSDDGHSYMLKEYLLTVFFYSTMNSTEQSLIIFFLLLFPIRGRSFAVTSYFIFFLVPLNMGFYRLIYPGGFYISIGSYILQTCDPALNGYNKDHSGQSHIARKLPLSSGISDSF